MAQWFEDDELWRVLEPVLFSTEILARAPVQIDAVSELLGFPTGISQRILDLPCGVGRHTVELARRGHRVTAVDRTSLYLERTRANLGAAGLAAEVLHGDMREFRYPSPGAFDAVFNLWTSFGYSQNPADDPVIMANFFACLRPGGRLVMEMNGRENLAKVFRERFWRTLEDGTLFLEENTLADDWCRVENRWLLVKNGRQQEIRFSLRLYSASDLKALAAAAGFCDIRCFGSLKGDPYDHKAERLVMVASKPV